MFFIETIDWIYTNGIANIFCARVASTHGPLIVASEQLLLATSVGTEARDEESI
jgi:hypothetical protein